MEKRGLKINVGKTQVMVQGKPLERGWRQEDTPVADVEEEWILTPIMCTGCGKWCYKRCLGLRNVNQAGVNYMCPA